MKFKINLLGLCALCGGLLLSACTSINTFPNIARPGDTISFMVGGSAQARKENISISLTDAGGHVFDLQALGRVRSVFNLRADGRAEGTHYSPYLESYISWAFGHEPLQTVMIADLPGNAAPGPATLTVTLNGITDNSSGTGAGPFTVSLEIIPGSGSSEQFLHPTLGATPPVDFTRLETAPNAQISFGTGYIPIGAASLVIDFDETAINPDDLNLYVPESTVRSGAFGMTQRMVYWHQDGQNLYVDIIAPQGIDPRYLQFFVVHPSGLAGSPTFNILNAQVYGTDGNLIDVTPALTYSP
ncbi:MAG: hypothetical protein H6R21_897 [Proteobacteria bacterium]|nr:hypothetical protein [Pseudomonadota bacterium]